MADTWPVDRSGGIMAVLSIGTLNQRRPGRRQRRPYWRIAFEQWLRCECVRRGPFRSPVPGRSERLGRPARVAPPLAAIWVLRRSTCTCVRPDICGCLALSGICTAHCGWQLRGRAGVQTLQWTICGVSPMKPPLYGRNAGTREAVSAAVRAPGAAGHHLVLKRFGARASPCKVRPVGPRRQHGGLVV